MLATMLELQGVTKRFGERLAVNDVSFEVKPGEFFGLLGPNGAGKSTTISMIVGSTAADEGRITLEGESINPTARGPKAKIGFVPQDIALYEDLTAIENLQFFGSLYPIGTKTIQDRIPVVLGQVGLQDRAQEAVHKYSGGMKRRLNIAVALLHTPNLLILDEPTVGVDPQSRNQIFDTLEALNREGMTVIYTSHYMEEVERLCNRIAIFDHGKMVTLGTKAEIAKLLPERNQLTVRLNEPVTETTLSQLRATFANVETPEERTLTFDIGKVEEDVPRMIQIVAGHGIAGLKTEESSLEDVFLHLTGKGLRD
jgi:ABC-2 type transport system ATP-binding protein